MKTPAVRLIIAALAATAVLAGCAKEITPPSFENDKVNPEGSRIIAVSFAPQTKTELDGLQPKFVDNDSILISNGDAIDTCRVSVVGENATISTNLTGPLTAVYPYKAAKMNDSNHNLIDTVLVSTVQDGTFASANICMARMTDENEESLSFENKTAVFCIKPAAGASSEYVEVKAEGFNIANDYPEGSTYTTCNTIHVAPITTDSVYVSILVPDGLKVSHLKFSDGTNEKAITTGAQAGEEIAAGTLYTVTATDWASPEADIPEPLSGKFSVSGDKQVQFSQGNLRYVVGTQEWGFYEHQYDFCNTSEYNGRHSDTVSLFTWGYDAEKSIVPNGNASDNVSTTSGNLKQTEDWGSQIGDGNTWRTLTKDEWAYLFESRSKASTLYKCGVTVCGKINCVVLLPDEWNETIIPLTNFATQTTYNESSTPKWSEMEAAGAVCLPAAGRRYGSNVSYVGSSGSYWSSTAVYTSTYYVNFNSGNVGTDNHDGRGNGCSVRLVTDVPSAPTPTEPDYVVITAKYDGEDNPGRPLKWSRQNLAITDSGNKKWKGENDTAVKVPGTNEDVIVGDYFQWAASYAGYGITDVAKQNPDSLLTYTAFTNTSCGDTKDEFTFIGSKQFDRANAPYKGSGYNYTKYTSSAETTLDPSDDVANIILGGNWHMPTSAEFDAMKKATYWAWDGKDRGYYVFKPGQGTNHIAGQRFSIADTDNKAEALLFFPAAGSGKNSDPDAVGSFGRYWSGTHSYTYSTSSGESLIFDAGNVYLQGNSRFYGFSVRPVSD